MGNPLGGLNWPVTLSRGFGVAPNAMGDSICRGAPLRPPEGEEGSSLLHYRDALPPRTVAAVLDRPTSPNV